MATAKKTGYKVLVDELSVHRDIGTLTDPTTNEVIGTQQGQGKIYFRGEVIPDDAVATSYKDALANPEHPSYAYISKRLEKMNEGESVDLAVRLGLPFAGYSDMEEDQIVALMANLPSPTIQSIKQYEAINDARSRIMDYSIGFGESPTDREEGRVGSDLDEENAGDENKSVSAITSREVTEDGIQRGEGITGTGDPDKEPGTEKGETTANGPASPRRQRRKRAGSNAANKGDNNGSSSENE